MKTETETQRAYQFLLKSRAREQWKKIGTKRRSGVATPLFSLYSKTSAGVGEIPDLKLLIDWCTKTSMSIIQLLPMNDVGFDFRPYDAQSSFALDPMYLALPELLQVNLKKYEGDIAQLRKDYPASGLQVQYTAKGAKLALLWNMFKSRTSANENLFTKYVEENASWLEDYALYKVVKEIHQGRNWESWGAPYKQRCPEAIQRVRAEHAQSFLFQQWLQWQLFEQFRKIKRVAEKSGVLLMGDLPFLVSRDSADVWSHQDYFKLHLASGAPPDAFFANGQRWGMPPYAWEKIEANGYDYVIQKLLYAQNFYDFFRIDHVVGMFRVWTIPVAEPPENGGLNGSFDPPNENEWESHGRKILGVMIDNTTMLPCAEDLGVVPDCSPRVLEEFGMVGMDVVRWAKNWKTDRSFLAPESYRKNSISVFSTHDMTSLAGWWAFDAETVDEEMFARKCASRGIPFQEVKGRIFDLERSFHGRLRWRKDVESREKLRAILGRNENEVGDILDLHTETYDEKNRFWRYLGLKGSANEKMTLPFVKATLAKAGQTASIFTIHLFQDWLSLSSKFDCDAWSYRINFPGTMDSRNWTLRLPFSLEELLELEANKTIKQMNAQSGKL